MPGSQGMLFKANIWKSVIRLLSGILQAENIGFKLVLETYSESSQTSEMELLAKIVNGFQP